ncbi:hypothetical protein LQ327_19325 [Actinomycetospora endophytica]|uniref:Serine/threonine protein kinase n=1 Tax=Actinomycetospora endophytica TaxID=2291215 RepID=A0ABS8PB74_9PSEU|nr:hypothetical protein [Actinomycetospora endophytica]MCD2195524.1 hypothetical protein [Actinomycetospora endophytica]
MVRSPFVTLAAVVVLGLVLVGVDMAVQHPAAPPAPPAAVPAVSAAPAPAAAPAPESFPAGRVRYVGDVTSQGASIPIAVTVDGDRSKAYVCDGHQTEAWLQGGATTDAVDGTGRHGNHMTGRLDGGRLTGTVSLAGRPDASFTAAPATGTQAGIYRSGGNGRTTGWIVRGDGGQVGLSHDGTGAVSPAPPLPLDGPLPAGVVPVDGSTDVLATS